MIELLTPPAKGEPANGAKGASSAPGGIDFAALFGTVAPVTAEGKAVPTPESATVPAVTAPAPILPTVPGITVPATVVDPSPPPAAVAPPAATTAPADPSADPGPVLAAAAAAPAVDAEADDASVDVVPASLAAKPMTIRPHGPVVVDEDAVKLPTLPADFVAQKAPRVQPAAAGDGEDKDEADETAAAPQVPVSAVALAPAQAQPAPDVATAVAATIVATRRAGVPPTKVADKTDLTAKADAATVATATGGQPDASPLIAVDTRTPAHGVDALVAASADQGSAAPPTPVLNPALPIATPTAAPVVDTSAIPFATQQSVALDDLMVAGAGDSAWLDRLSTDITTLASGSSREAHMKLNPRSLGDMSIRLDMDGQSTRVHFTVETQAAATLISDGTQKLTSLVQANGLKLDGATVDLSQRRGDGRPSDQNPRQADAPATIARARSETARLIERTRIAVATERFA